MDVDIAASLRLDCHLKKQKLIHPEKKTANALSELSDEKCH